MSLDMSDPVERDLARYEREQEQAQAREEAIEQEFERLMKQEENQPWHPVNISLALDEKLEHGCKPEFLLQFSKAYTEEGDAGIGRLLLSISDEFISQSVWEEAERNVDDAAKYDDY